MSELTRRGVLGGTAVTLMTLAQAQAQDVTPERGGTLTSLITPEPPVLILGVNSQGSTLIAASKIYQGLLKYSPTLEPLPELAKSWSISTDRRTYTFTLQDNVVWHDGAPMTADDVLFSIMKFHMELSPRSRDVFNRINAATASDTRTVLLTLDAPFEPFLLMFDVTTTAIMPKHIYDAPGATAAEYRNNPANQTPIGTGPFKLAEWQRGNFIRLVCHDKYWKPSQPYLDEIIYRVLPDSQSRSLALQTGQVMMTAANDIEPFDVPRFREQPNLDVTTKGWEFFSPLMWIELNHRVKPLDDVRVRQAISHAMDRDFVLRRLWFGVGKVATGPIASTTPFYDKATKLPGYDPKRAAALMDEAGLKPNAQGIRFTIKHLTLPYGEVWTRFGEYVRTALKAVGIEVVLEATDAVGWARRLADWEYETTVNFVYQYGDPTLGVERTYVSSNIKKLAFANTGGYANPAVDALFAEASAAADAAARQVAFSKVQALLAEEIPQIWMIEMAFPTITDRKLHNVIELGTGVYASFDDVFIS